MTPNNSVVDRLIAALESGQAGSVSQRSAALMLRNLTQSQVVAPTEDALTDLIAENMTGVYHCTRVWSAWGVGTMSKDDFDPYADSESPRELAQTILAAIGQAAADATHNAVLHACDEALAAVPDERPIKSDWDRGFRDGLKCAVTAVRAALHKR